MSLGLKLLKQLPTKIEYRSIVESVPAKTKQDIVAALDYLNPDDYKAWIDNLMRLKTLGDAGKAIAIDWSKTSAKFDLSEFESKWGSLEPDRTGYKAIFNEAVKNGWINSGKTKVPKAFKLLSVAEVMQTPSIGWLVKGLLPARGLGAIFGASSSGKTFLVLDMLMAICRGHNWLGYRIRAKHTVVYLALEGGAGIKDRLNAYLQHNQLTAPDNFYLIISPFDVRADTDELIAAIAGVNPAIVVIDTLNQAAPGADENSNVDMSLITAKGQEIATAIKGLALYIHHSGKDAAKGLRGHSSLNAALDIAIEVRAPALTPRSFRVTKSKDGTAGKESFFKLQTIGLGVDADGDIVDSCIVLPETEVPASLPTGKNQIIAHGVLTAAVGHLNKEEKIRLVADEIKKVNPALKRPNKAAEIAIKALEITSTEKHV